MKRIILLGAILIAAMIISGTALAETAVRRSNSENGRVIAEPRGMIGHELCSIAESSAEAPEPVETEKPAEKPSETASPTETPAQTDAPTDATETDVPSESPAPTALLAPFAVCSIAESSAEAPEPAETEKPAEKPSETASPTEAPSQTEAPAQTDAPAPTEAPTDVPTDAPTESPSPSETDSPTDSPSPSDSPAPTETPEPEKRSESRAAPVRKRAPLKTTAFDAIKMRRLNAKRAPFVRSRADTRLTRARDWLGVVATDEIGMPIPAKFQLDYPETVITIGGVDRSVATSGCGAACLAMVLEYLNGESYTPDELFARSVRDGKYRGYGWSAEILCDYARAYGVNATVIAADEAQILAALESGKPVIALMGEGIFTNQGHYLVLRGVSSAGKILINDPNSRANTKRAFPIQTILRQSKGTFIICEKQK